MAKKTTTKKPNAKVLAMLSRNYEELKRDCGLSESTRVLTDSTERIDTFHETMLYVASDIRTINMTESRLKALFKRRFKMLEFRVTMEYRQKYGVYRKTEEKDKNGNL